MSTKRTYRLSPARSWLLNALRFPPYRRYCSLQNVPSSVDITINRNPTVRAVMSSMPQLLRNSFAALVALLACASGVNSHERLSGPFSLIKKSFRELIPSCVTNTFGEPAFHHPLDIQVLNGNQVVRLNNDFRQFMGEVRPAIGNLQMQASQSLLGLQSPLAAFLLPSKRTIRATELPFQPAELPRGWNAVAVRGGDERIQSDVDANRGNNRHLAGQRLSVVNQNLGEPPIGAANDSQGLLRALDIPQVATVDVSEFRNEHHAVACVVPSRGAVDRMPAVSALESRKSRLISSFDPTKKGIKSLLEPVDRVPLKNHGNTPHLLTVLSPLREHLRLCHVRSGFAAPLVNLDPMLKEVIPNAAGALHPRQ